METLSAIEFIKKYMGDFDFTYQQEQILKAFDNDTIAICMPRKMGRTANELAMLRLLVTAQSNYIKKLEEKLNENNCTKP